MVEILLGHIKGDAISDCSSFRFLQDVLQGIAERIFLQPATMFLSISPGIVTFTNAVSFGLGLFLMGSCRGDGYIRHRSQQIPGSSRNARQSAMSG